MYNIVSSSEEDNKIIENNLIEFNRKKAPFTQEEEFVDLNYHVKDEQGNIIAGICASMYLWHVVIIRILFVHESYRGKQLGSALLLKVENEAKQRGAKLIHLNTFLFQAKDFYLKFGYEVFGQIDNYPEAKQFFFLKKHL